MALRDSRGACFLFLVDLERVALFQKNTTTRHTVCVGRISVAEEALCLLYRMLLNFLSGVPCVYILVSSDCDCASVRIQGDHLSCPYGIGSDLRSDDAGLAELSGHDSGVAEDTAFIGDDAGGAFHRRDEIRSGHGRDEYFAGLQFIGPSSIGDYPGDAADEAAESALTLEGGDRCLAPFCSTGLFQFSDG